MQPLVATTAVGKDVSFPCCYNAVKPYAEPETNLGIDLLVAPWFLAAYYSTFRASCDLVALKPIRLFALRPSYIMRAAFGAYSASPLC